MPTHHILPHTLKLGAVNFKKRPVALLTPLNCKEELHHLSLTLTEGTQITHMHNNFALWSLQIAHTIVNTSKSSLKS